MTQWATVVNIAGQLTLWSHLIGNVGFGAKKPPSGRFFHFYRNQKFSQSGQAGNRQQRYHRALEIQHPEHINIVLGSHAPQVVKQVRAAEPLDLSDRVPVWRLEEKESDVRLALAVYRDVARGDVEQVVICSNDSDLAPALALIREDYPTTKVGVIIPRGKDSSRPPSGKLERYADWTRTYIRDDELASAQLPSKVIRQGAGIKTKVFKCPPEWKPV